MTDGIKQLAVSDIHYCCSLTEFQLIFSCTHKQTDERDCVCNPCIYIKIVYIMIAATSSIGLLYFILYTRIDIDMFFFKTHSTNGPTQKMLVIVFHTQSMHVYAIVYSMFSFYPHRVKYVYV